MSEHGRDGTTTDEDSDGRTGAETRSTTETETDDENDEQADRAHLDDVPDGSGCTEIWERLSERRADAERE